MSHVQPDQDSTQKKEEKNTKQPSCHCIYQCMEIGKSENIRYGCCNKKLNSTKKDNAKLL